MSPTPADAADPGNPLDPGVQRVVAGAELDGIATLLARQPATPLLEALQQVIDALAAAGVVTERSSWLDRLLGRDLVRQAHPDPAAARVRVQLQAAATHAEATRRFIADLDAAAARLDIHARALCELMADARAVAPAGTLGDSQLRRLQRLDALLASWQSTGVQLRLARANAEAVLEQHVQVRDLLVPLWQQHRSTRSAGRHVDLHALQGTVADRLRRLRTPSDPRIHQESST